MVLFDDSKVGSDSEDVGGDGPPVRVTPEWRSTLMGQCCHLLDKITRQSAITERAMKSYKDTYLRADAPKVSKAEDLVGVPIGLPEDCYSEEWKSNLTGIQKTALAMSAKVSLGLLKAQLDGLLSKSTSGGAGPSASGGYPAGSTCGTGNWVPGGSTSGIGNGVASEGEHMDIVPIDEGEGDELVGKGKGKRWANSMIGE